MKRTPPLRLGPRTANGFTLLELLVVIVVFAVMAMMAYGGLSQVLKARAAIEQKQARTEAYQTFYLRMRSDFQNAAQRTVRDNDGISQPAMIYDGTAKSLEFTRGGRPNPLYLPRTGFERVAYRIDDDKLIRRSWHVLDRAPQTQPDDVTLMDGVDECKWRFLGSPAQNLGNIPGAPNPAAQTNTQNNIQNDLQWSDTWPINYDSSQAATNPPPPVAVELTLRTRDWGDLRFLFKLGFDPAGATPTSAQPGPPSTNLPPGNNPQPNPLPHG
jgi:general secretion pathway protein J